MRTGAKIIPLQEYNMTFVSTTSETENNRRGNSVFPDMCDVSACFSAPR